MFPSPLITTFLLLTTAIESRCSLGSFLTSVGQKESGQLQFNAPVGIAVHPSGKVFIADNSNNRIQVLHSDLSYTLTCLAVRGVDRDSLVHPTMRSLTVVVQYMLLTTTTIVCRSSLLTDSSSPRLAARGLKRVNSTTQQGICVDFTDTVYISEEGNNRVSVFSSSGQFLKCFGSYGSGKGQFQSPTGVAIDNTTGNMFVCDWGNDCVVTY